MEVTHTGLRGNVHLNLTEQLPADCNIPATLYIPPSAQASKNTLKVYTPSTVVSNRLMVHGLQVSLSAETRSKQFIPLSESIPQPDGKASMSIQHSRGGYSMFRRLNRTLYYGYYLTRSRRIWTFKLGSDGRPILSRYGITG